MACKKGEYDIGVRAYEEVKARYGTIVKAMAELKISRKAIQYWNLGATPTGYCLQRLAEEHFDIVYILTGKRTKE